MVRKVFHDDPARFARDPSSREWSSLPAIIRDVYSNRGVDGPDKWVRLFAPAGFELPANRQFSGIASSASVRARVGARVGSRSNWGGHLPTKVQSILDTASHFDCVKDLESPHGAIHVYCKGPMQQVPWAGFYPAFLCVHIYTCTCTCAGAVGRLLPRLLMCTYLHMHVYMCRCRGQASTPPSYVYISTHARGHVQVPWAGFYPAFWLHHCNVDRLWESYLAIPAHQDSEAEMEWNQDPDNPRRRGDRGRDRYHIWLEPFRHPRTNEKLRPADCFELLQTYNVQYAQLRPDRTRMREAPTLLVFPQVSICRIHMHIYVVYI